MFDLSIVIASWNTGHLLRDCLMSLTTATDCLVAEIIVVDNASSDGSPDMVRREFSGVRLIANDANAGFARANNQGIAASAGRHVLLLNSDTRVPPDSLRQIVSFMDQHPEAGACSPRLVTPDGQPQAFAFGGDPTLLYLLRRGVASLLLRKPLHDWSTSETRQVDWVSGACLMARREAIEQIGMLDEDIFMYFEDNDWCLRIRKGGWKIYYCPEVSITHIGGQSVRQSPAARQVYYQSLMYFYGKHFGPLAQYGLKLCLLPYRLLAGR